MQNYVQKGDVVTLTAPYAVASGAGLKVGGIVGIATAAALISASVEVMLAGVFDVTRETGGSTAATLTPAGGPSRAVRIVIDRGTNDEDVAGVSIRKPGPRAYGLASDFAGIARGDALSSGAENWIVDEAPALARDGVTVRVRLRAA